MPRWVETTGRLMTRPRKLDPIGIKIHRGLSDSRLKWKNMSKQ